MNLALALAVGAGAIPRPGAGGNGTTIAASAKIDELAAPAARQPGDVPPDTAAAPTTTAAPTTAPPTTAVKTTTPTTKAVKTTATTKVPATTAAPAPAAAAAAPAAAPAAPATVARRVPSAAEVSQAIATLPQYVSTIFTPTPAQVAQLGDQVCTAFDQGQTFAQVKATGLSMITQVPLTTVKPGGADWVVKTIVNLYCPGYASKLV
ncbi:MAG TPA: hypothetical protein VL337_01330 [Acidimicrobiales bacterium]|nr:hypothetical protein [Acidimicrobiales bacterium]